MYLGLMKAWLKGSVSLCCSGTCHQAFKCSEVVISWTSAALCWAVMEYGDQCWCAIKVPRHADAQSTHRGQQVEERRIRMKQDESCRFGEGMQSCFSSFLPSLVGCKIMIDVQSLAAYQPSLCASSSLKQRKNFPEPFQRPAKRTRSRVTKGETWDEMDDWWGNCIAHTIMIVLWSSIGCLQSITEV